MTQNELEFLRYFYYRARDGMGPASDEIYRMIKEDWGRMILPEGYEIEEEDEDG